MRQVSDKADGVGEEDGLASRERKAPGGWVEGSEKLVLGKNARSGEGVKEARFPDVRVADDRARRRRDALAPLTLGRAVLTDGFELFFYQDDAILHPAAIELELGFARAFRAVAATALPRKRGVGMREPGK